ncbi:tyrosine-type recombinase/integrase [Macrococcus animalis]|uniref:tyrosine-type recombinase/integrase n=1 Tax=Macrococcus animalis TaxID=3395467 RepID=UPI0039BEB50D
MHIQELDDGNYKVTLEAPRDPVTGKRQQITRRHKSKREAIKRAEAEYDKRMTSLGHYGALNNDSPTFRQVAEKFMEEYKRKEKISTYNSRKQNLVKLYEYMNFIEIKKINHKMCQNVIDDMMLGEKRIYSKSYTQSVKGTLNLIMDYALKNGIISVNPALNCKYPKPLVTVEDLERTEFFEESISKKDTLAMFEEFKSDRYKYKDSYEFFMTMYYTGMRPGEVMALKINDIDFNKNEIRVTKTLYNPDDKKRGHQLIPPKNNDSRIISISDTLAVELKTIIEKRKQTKDLFGDQYIDEDFLFCDHFGDPYKSGIVYKRFRAACEVIGIKDKKFRPHTFRHTHTTNLIEAGVSPKDIQERLGHKNINTTLGIYAHVTQKSRDQVVTIFDDHMEKALKLDKNEIEN